MRKRLLRLLTILAGLFLSAAGAAAAERLSIFIWSEYLDPEVVKVFEHRFSAKVTVDVYEDAEGMLAKLQGGGSGLYDVVVPPDHLVRAMVELKLLTPLRPANLPNLKNLDPKFARPPFDPKNEFTVAYQWGTLGLYYRKREGHPPPDSWAAVFDPQRTAGPFVLIDSMRDAIGAALKFRGHALNATDLPALKEARDLLLNAKGRCVAFEGSVGAKNRVLAKTATVALCYSGEAVRGIGEDAGTAYVIPKEGSEIWMDNLAIPARASNRDLAEKFINFVLEPEIGARISNFTQFATPNAAARPLIKPEDLKNPTIYPPAEVMARLEFVEDLGSKNRLYDQVWTQVKAK